MAPTAMNHRRFLKQLSDQLTIGDVGSMKFVCRGKIGAGLLEKVDNEKPLKLLELLEQTGLISPSDLSCLRELFIRIQRFDLAASIPGGEEKKDAIDSGAPLSPSNSSISHFRSFLKKLADELTSTQVEEVKFLLGVPGGLTAKIQDGQSLLLYMEENGHLSETNLGDLKNVLRDVHRMDLIQKVEQFSCKGGSLPGSQEVTSPVSLVSAHLMKPSDFSSPSSVVPEEEEQIPSYSITSPVGYALIINNELFTGKTNYGETLNRRIGTQVDLDNLKDLWNKLGFQVKSHKNLKAHTILTVVQDIATTIDHASASSCFVCCLLSHGSDGAIYGADCKLVQISDIMGFFKEGKCAALAGKPKLFFIQACRGQNRLTITSELPVGTAESNVNLDAAPPDAGPPDARNQEDRRFRQSADPNERHFLLGYATPPGFVSWRSTKEGSWYISALVEMFAKYFQKEDVLSMMVRVNEKVSGAFSSKGYTQCPAPVVTLTKRVYLNCPPS